MEEQLYQALQCPPGSRVLDAGCGSGIVALYVARRGNYKIDAVDVTPRHVAVTQRNVKRAGMEASISVQLGDHHHLGHLESASFDGVYTMETLCHASDPLKVLKGFHRVLKPGSRIVIHDYDHDTEQNTPDKVVRAFAQIADGLNVPAVVTFEFDVLKHLLIDAGCTDVELVDLTSHGVPMLWLFYILTFIPFHVVRLLRIEGHFINIVLGYIGYEGSKVARYIQVTGKKSV